MKNLLLIAIIFLSLTVKSQHNPVSHSIFADCDSTPMIIIPTEEEMDKLYKQQLIYDLSIVMKEYKKDCYNDSAFVDVYIDPNHIVDLEDGFEFITCIAGYYEKQWVHKEPTFEDFMEWIIKKDL